MKRFFAWFTTPRRKAIYGLVTAGTIAVVAFGVVSQDQLNAAVVSVTAVVNALATLMAFVNTGGVEQ